MAYDLTRDDAELEMLKVVRNGGRPSMARSTVPKVRIESPADSGRLTGHRTLGGYRRYRETEARMLFPNGKDPEITRSR